MKNIIIIFLILISIPAISQNNLEHKVYKNNILFAEIGGIGGYGSVNYEHVFFNKDMFKISIRGGISSYNFNDFRNNFNPDIVIPVSFYVFWGNNHNIDFGIGQTLSSIVYFDMSDYNISRNINFSLNASIGYRYQRDSGGLFFKCTYSPIYDTYSIFKHWLGMSLGYSF